jgi:hypothetical protein
MEVIMKVSKVENGRVFGILNGQEVCYSMYLGNTGGQYHVNIIDLTYCETNKTIDLKTLKDLGLEMNLNSIKIAYLRDVIVTRKKEKN